MNPNHKSPGYILFEDGALFKGYSFHGKAACLGEAVFNTSHSGYQEILTDPSYSRQIITFTAPHIGNVGVNKQDYESSKIHAAGAVIRSLAPQPSNWRAEKDLVTWLNEAEVPILADTDTRAVTLHIRDKGAMRAGIFPASVPVNEAREQILDSPSMSGLDLAGDVSCKSAYTFSKDDLDPNWYQAVESGSGLRVAVLDFGVKQNILRELASRGCEVNVLPASTSSTEIISGGFDGILISNGPGDPAAISYGIETVATLLKADIPLFGICLGHQLLALAAGLETFKLPFGHRGANHPVRRESDKAVEITSQNHGFAVKSEGLGADWSVTHINLNDNTIEGLKHINKPFFSIQYHPEASPGPHEGRIYFDRFIEEMRHAKA
ncbi:MAG: glutamine-hydrolyzing carbamoyl-phosphate synthase small subunit [Calditrichaeota bacterium]|nr:glutamine-hydrolyzing carbamoyl-phosphate synthase small subunit [Calditrichota bacterium]